MYRKNTNHIARKMNRITRRPINKKRALFGHGRTGGLAHKVIAKWTRNDVAYYPSLLEFGRARASFRVFGRVQFLPNGEIKIFADED